MERLFFLIRAVAIFAQGLDRGSAMLVPSRLRRAEPPPPAEADAAVGAESPLEPLPEFAA